MCNENKVVIDTALAVCIFRDEANLHLEVSAGKEPKKGEGGRGAEGSEEKERRGEDGMMRRATAE